MRRQLMAATTFGSQEVTREELFCYFKMKEKQSLLSNGFVTDIKEQATTEDLGQYSSASSRANIHYFNDSNLYHAKDGEIGGTNGISSEKKNMLFDEEARDYFVGKLDYCNCNDKVERLA
ncbi:unnamed protein product [Dovyalis caffra]|uniref:Uncharacterized protein n=1 Tax=Dovyalis caffra TaxID=77055 RepID=A0AAV1S021_9ROSI|nr:unnamed protein product [Dovyalis caffra]